MTLPDGFRVPAAPRRDDEGYATGLRNLRRTVQAVGDLPGVEDLRDNEVDALGTVVSEILER